jgi:hypothetical protein
VRLVGVEERGAIVMDKRQLVKISIVFLAMLLNLLTGMSKLMEGEYLIALVSIVGVGIFALMGVREFEFLRKNDEWNFKPTAIYFV